MKLIPQEKPSTSLWQQFPPPLIPPQRLPLPLPFRDTPPLLLHENQAEFRQFSLGNPGNKTLDWKLFL